MDKTYFSASWYRVATLRLRLRSHVVIYRTIFRGDVWHVMQDRTSGRFHRFTPEAHFIISLMDGRRTMQQVWDVACRRLEEKVITQDAVIRLLGQLHAADVLLGDVPPDIEEIAERAKQQRNRRLLSSFANPLAIRVGLMDPNEFLNATFPVLRPLFSWFGAFAFAALVTYAVIQAAINWDVLTNNLTDRVLAAQNLFVILVTYPFVKALHELGHAYAVKRWGGDVHEIGVMMLVFMPVPYVDASDSLAFQSKWQRALVGSAGIIVELTLASIALLAWLNAEEGIFRAFAFNVMLIGGVSTLLFNGNPLLRFDGYYVLCDLLEMPNLGSRANRYFGYLVQRYAFGVETAMSPSTARGEEFWFLTYGTASFFYRIMVMAAIAAVVSQRFFYLGTLIAFWSAVLILGVPLAKHVWFLLTSPVLRRNRGRAFAVVGGGLGCMALPLFVIPFPYATVAQGVVWLPGDGVVNTGIDGIVGAVLAKPGTTVSKGDALIRLRDPIIKARAELLDLRVEELQRRLATKDFLDPISARILREELQLAHADYAVAKQRESALVVRASRSGVLVIPEAKDLPGQFVHRGETLAYIARWADPTIRVIVPENSADLVRSETQRVSVRFAEDPTPVYAARIVREVPSLTAKLPNAALSTAGGGNIPLDPTDPSQQRTLENLLHLELKLEHPMTVDRIGGRVYVRFFHGYSPLAARIYRSMRQVFLGVFKI